MDVDVLFVGGGPACLAGAIHLMNRIREHNRNVEKGKAPGKRIEDPVVVLIDKGAEIGAHSLSGAVMDPVTLRELIPDYEKREAPIEWVIEKESLYYLSSRSGFRAPRIPRPLRNRGNCVVSLSRLTRWLGKVAAESGCEIFPGFSGVEVLFDGDRVVGVRTGDKGIDRQGNRKENFEPGVDLMAKVTLFGEGPRGNLTKALIPRLGLDEGKEPMTYLTGAKEVWEVGKGGEEVREVIHTLGYPFSSDTYGGGFVYPMSENRMTLGILGGVNSPDPFFDIHDHFQRLKQHPKIRSLLRNGKLLEYGAKTVSVGGYYSVPRLSFDGGMLVGDCGGIFDSQRIKGIHLSMKSGMLAAEAALSALMCEDSSRAVLREYEEKLRESYVGRDLAASRNFHQGFERGILTGAVNAVFGWMTGGRGLTSWPRTRPDHEEMKKVSEYYGVTSRREPVRPDGEITFDKTSDVFCSGTVHEEDQPCHLHVEDLSICHGRCREEYGNPCVRFCPAGVYEMNRDEENGEERLRINASNCVHCKTCDIRDPYGIIHWVPPEGGGGPRYTLM